MKKQIVIGLSLLGLAVCSVSCRKSPAPEPEPPFLKKKHRTVIEYMVADNNLYPYAELDINEMEAAWDDRFDGYMVVFLYPVAETSRYAPARADYDEDPRLLLIARDRNAGTMSSRVLKRYDRLLDPTDPETVKQVIEDAVILAPADHYALIFWSHGSGWIPQGLGQPLKSTQPSAGDDASGAVSKLEGWAPAGADRAGIMTYSFGQSNSHGNAEMEIDALARTLPTGKLFDFILFDACHMASVEVVWELKDFAAYLIASAAETLAYGFPYEAVLAPMFEKEADVKGVAKAFFDDYKERTGAWQSATIGVVRCDRLPAVAEALRALCEAGLPAAGISYAGQQYGRSSMGFQNTFYDLTDFVRRTWGASDPEGVARFEAAMDEAVVFAAATPWLFDQLKIGTHCGLSCYLPRSSTPLSLEAYRTRFGWSGASGMGNLIVP